MYDVFILTTQIKTVDQL